jgi:hypothetical protein
MDKIYFLFLKILVLLLVFYLILKMTFTSKEKGSEKIIILLFYFALIFSLFLPSNFLVFQIGIVFVCIFMFWKGNLYKKIYYIETYSESLLYSLTLGYILFVVAHIITVVTYFITKNKFFLHYLSWLILILCSIFGGIFSEIMNQKNFLFNKWIYPLFISFLIGILSFRPEEIKLYGKYFELKRCGYTLFAILLFSFVGCKIGEKIKTVAKWNKRSV